MVVMVVYQPSKDALPDPGTRAGGGCAGDPGPDRLQGRATGYAGLARESLAATLVVPIPCRAGVEVTRYGGRRRPVKAAGESGSFPGQRMSCHDVPRYFESTPNSGSAGRGAGTGSPNEGRRPDR